MASRTEFENRCNLRIVRKIATGGMGAVSEAIQFGAGGFEKRVAIKEILPSESHNKFVEMFIGEAKLVANLVHENIVQIYQLNQSDNGYYIVMELVNGLSLADFIGLHSKPIGSEKSIPVELAVFIVSRIARGLAYAHNRTDRMGKALKIVHRDVCPKNILITTEGLPKLGDFGIASAENLQLSSDDQQAMGKFSYMSPEQARATAVDFRADIFSLGLVLFELLTLRRARKKWDESLIVAAVNGWIDWELLPKKTPRKLTDLLKKMLAENPSHRYQSTDELAQDLELYIYGKGYGPTVVTLEKYLRSFVPQLYDHRITSFLSEDRPESEATAMVEPDEHTRML